MKENLKIKEECAIMSFKQMDLFGAADENTAFLSQRLE